MSENPFNFENYHYREEIVIVRRPITHYGN